MKVADVPNLACNCPLCHPNSNKAYKLYQLALHLKQKHGIPYNKAVGKARDIRLKEIAGIPERELPK